MAVLERPVYVRSGEREFGEKCGKREGGMEPIQHTVLYREENKQEF